MSKFIAALLFAWWVWAALQCNAPLVIALAAVIFILETIGKG